MAEQETYTLSELERKHGYLALDRKKYAGNKKLTESEFFEAITNNRDDFHGVNFEDREKFLKDNGYDVTHENMIADLPAVSK